MRYINVFGVPHAYTLTAKRVSAKEAIVFAHGWLLSQCYWQPIIQLLQNDYQCLSYDLRGFGASNQELQQRHQATVDASGATTAYTLEAYAQDLGKLVESLKLEKVWVVGHSLGGSIALWAAKLFPQRVAGVICVNAGGGVYLPEEFSRFRRAGKQIVRWRPAWLASMPMIARAFTHMMVFHPLSLEWGKQRVVDFLAAHEEAAIASLLESTTEAEVHQLPQVVADLAQPVHFIAGAKDTIMQEKYVRHLASFHPSFQDVHSNVTVLPECGHMAMLEQPTALAAKIQIILKTTQSAHIRSEFG